jgi:hypothetical protein
MRLGVRNVYSRQVYICEQLFGVRHMSNELWLGALPGVPQIDGTVDPGTPVFFWEEKDVFGSKVVGPDFDGIWQPYATLPKSTCPSIEEWAKRVEFTNVHRRALPANHYYPRMCRPLDVGVPVDRSALADTLLAVEILNKRLREVLESVYPAVRQLNVYGHHVRNLLLLACMDVVRPARVFSGQTATPTQLQEGSPAAGTQTTSSSSASRCS